MTFFKWIRYSSYNVECSTYSRHRIPSFVLALWQRQKDHSGVQRLIHHRLYCAIYQCAVVEKICHLSYAVLLVKHAGYVRLTCDIRCNLSQIMTCKGFIFLHLIIKMYSYKQIIVFHIHIMVKRQLIYM